MNSRPRWGILWMIGTLVVVAVVAIVAYGVGAASSGSIGWWLVVLVLLLPLLIPFVFVTLGRLRGPWPVPMGHHASVGPGQWLDEWHTQAHGRAPTRPEDQAASG